MFLRKSINNMHLEPDQFIRTSSIGLGATFILLVVLVLSITMSLSAFINYRIQKDHFQTQLKLHGESLGKFIALTSSDAVLNKDYLVLNQYAREITHVEDVVYGVILSTDHKNMTSYLNRQSDYIKEFHDEDVLNIIKSVNKNREIISMKFPVLAGETIAYVQIGLSTKRIDKLTRNALLQQFFGMLIIISILGIVIYLLFKRKVLKPIYILVKNIQSISTGDLHNRVEITSNNEFKILAKAFNHMADSLSIINDEKDAYAEKLRTTNNELESATQSKSLFLANMSHEIRTPLTAIIGFSEILLDENTQLEERISSINTIIRNGNHLLHLINEILDLSKIEANKLEVERIEIPVTQLMQEVQSLIDLQARTKGLEFTINYDLPIPEFILSDPVRIKQILINLCNNAIKFTAEGKVNVQLSYTSSKHILQFQIQDTGIGMTEDQVEKLFAPFSQADASTTRKYGGTGLGLHLSKQLAEKLGGELTVTSSSGKGSCFTLTLHTDNLQGAPLLKEIPIETIVSDTLTNSDISGTGKVLLAEDNPDNQRLISMYLSKFGADVSIAENGEVAVNMALQGDFDLVLMDMQMPVMDGILATRNLREQGYKKPIVSLTANTMKEDQKKCIDAGCNEFVSKPINKIKFYEILSKYLNKPEEKPANESAIVSSLLEDDPEFIFLVKKYISLLPSIIENIHNSYNQQDWKEVKRQLHDLKSTSGGHGYLQIMDIAANLDFCLTKEDYSAVERGLDKLHKLCERAKKGL